MSNRLRVRFREASAVEGPVPLLELDFSLFNSHSEPFQVLYAVPHVSVTTPASQLNPFAPRPFIGSGFIHQRISAIGAGEEQTWRVKLPLNQATLAFIERIRRRDGDVYFQVGFDLLIQKTTGEVLSFSFDGGYVEDAEVASNNYCTVRIPASDWLKILRLLWPRNPGLLRFIMAEVLKEDLIYGLKLAWTMLKPKGF